MQNLIGKQLTAYGLQLFKVVSCMLLVVSLFGCGQSQTSSVGGGGGSEGSVTSTSTITGQVAISSTDLTTSGIRVASIIKPSFRTLANSALGNVEVKLYEVKADGSKVDTGKVATTDTSGNYTMTGIANVDTGTYIVEAVKPLSGDNIRVSSLVVLNSDTSSNETVNISPETKIAAALFDNVLKEKYSSVTVNPESMKELKNLVTDDTGQLVNNEKLTLPSSKDSKIVQVKYAAEGIAENRGNAEKAFKKLSGECLYNTASAGDPILAEKYLNNLTTINYGNDGLLSKVAASAFTQALLNKETKSLTEIVDAANLSVTGGTVSISADNIKAQINTSLDEIQTKYDQATAGTSHVSIDDPLFMVFSESERKNGISTDKSLNVGQQIVVKEILKSGLGQGKTLDDVTFADKLGYISSGLGISLSEPFFKDFYITYGSYGAWKLGGHVTVSIPQTSAYQNVTVESVQINENGIQIASFEPSGSEGINFTLQHPFGPVVALGRHTYTIQANLDTSRASAPVSSEVLRTTTIEVVEIPGVWIYQFDGQPFEGTDEYYNLTKVSDKQPILIFSTQEVAGIAPSGYSWAYFYEVRAYKTKNGATTLEVDMNNAVSPSDPAEQAEYFYASGSDLSSLIRNNSFLCPLELKETYGGLPIAYGVHLQRVLLDEYGNERGWGSGSNITLRYGP